MKYKSLIGILILAVVLVGVQAYAGTITIDGPANHDRFLTYEFFDTALASGSTATTTSAVSTAVVPSYDASGRYVDGSILLSGAKGATFYFGRGDTIGTGNAGSSAFTVEVTPDGSNWFTYGHLYVQNATSTPSYIATAILTGTTTVMADMDLRTGAFLKARCRVVEATDGDHRCRASVVY